WLWAEVWSHRMNGRSKGDELDRLPGEQGSAGSLHRWADAATEPGAIHLGGGAGCVAARARYSRRAGHLGAAHLARADMVRSGGDVGYRYAVYRPLRPARCPGEADAGRAPGAEPSAIVVRVRGWIDIRLYPAPRHRLPQRRPRDRRGRKIFL